MDIPSAGATELPAIPITTASQLLTLSSICPACGYPAVGMGLCAYCEPLTRQVG